MELKTREVDVCVEVALAADQNYFKGLLVAAMSIARHASRDARLVFHILDGGIEDASFGCLETAVCEAHEKSCVRRLKADLSLFADFPTLNGTTMAYARFLLPRLVQADFVVYCDVDFLCLADVAELWKLADPESAILSTPELNPVTLERERAWCGTHGIEFRAGGYFCSGLSFMNLRKIREFHLDEKCLGFLAENRDVNFHDQSALNFVIWREKLKVTMLPRKWQVFTYDVRPEDFRDSLFLHYAGNTPWMPVKMITDAEVLWYRHYAAAAEIDFESAVRQVHSPFRYWRGRILFRIFASQSGRMAARIFFKLLGRRRRAEEIIRLARRLPAKR